MFSHYQTWGSVDTAFHPRHLAVAKGESDTAPFDLQPILFLIQSLETKWHPSLWASWCTSRQQIPPCSQVLDIRGSTLTNASWLPLRTSTLRWITQSLTTTGEVTLQTKLFGGRRLNVSSFSSCLMESMVSPDSKFHIGDSPLSQKFAMTAFVFNTAYGASPSSQVHPEQVWLHQSSSANGILLLCVNWAGKCLSATLHALSDVHREFYSKPGCQGLHIWLHLQGVSGLFQHS